MPNRLIKESICTSPNLDALSPEEEILFYRLIVNCDDYGRLDARPTIIRAKCFPLKIDRIKDADINKWLSALVAHKLIVLYTVDGCQYLQIITWSDHQQVRARRSKYPAIEHGVITSDINGNQMITSDIKCPRNPIQSNPIQSESNPNPMGVDKNLFNTFWEKYPRKVAKAAAEKSFAKLKPDKKLLNLILEKLELYKKSDAWQKDGGQFIPYPATWLNGRRWEDEITGGVNGKTNSRSDGKILKPDEFTDPEEYFRKQRNEH